MRPWCQCFQDEHMSTSLDPCQGGRSQLFGGRSTAPQLGLHSLGWYPSMTSIPLAFPKGLAMDGCQSMGRNVTCVKACGARVGRERGLVHNHCRMRQRHEGGSRGRELGMESLDHSACGKNVLNL